MSDIHDPTTWPSLAEPDQEFLAAIKPLGGAPDLGGFGSIAAMREAIEKSKAAMNRHFGAVAGVKEEDRQVKMRDGQEITVRIHAPGTPPSGGSPLGIMLHGGGFCIGSLTSEALLCQRMAAELGMTVVNVGYRLGPEFKHPTALFDCWDATKWAAANASALGADPSQGFTISGTSAGGNMAAVISHLARDEALTPSLTGIHLMAPLLCSPLFFPAADRADWKSWHQLPDAAILNHRANDLFMDNYIPDKAQRADPLYSPFLWGTGHKGLAPHFLQIAGLDPLRDEALIYERRLRLEDGVRTRLEVYPGLPHGFWSIFPELEASRRFVEDAIVGVGWLLGKR